MPITSEYDEERRLITTRATGVLTPEDLAHRAFFKATPPRSGMAFVLARLLDRHHESLPPQLILESPGRSGR